MMVATLESEQAMLNACYAFIELFHEGLCSKVAAPSGRDLQGMLSTTAAKRSNGLKGQERKSPLNRSTRKKRKL